MISYVAGLKLDLYSFSLFLSLSLFHFKRTRIKVGLSVSLLCGKGERERERERLFDQMDEDGNVGFEEGLCWLPSHVLDEAICHDSKEQSMRPHHHHRHHHEYRLRYKFPADHPPVRSKGNMKAQHKQRNQANNWKWSSGGPGMQAIFLDSGQRSCGTGVFLPRPNGTDFPLTKKPAYSPVLLPTRVVQALNLNVHALASPTHQDQSNNLKHGNGNSSNNNNNGKSGNDALKNVGAQCCVQSESGSPSPEIFLPKEWSY